MLYTYHENRVKGLFTTMTQEKYALFVLPFMLQSTHRVNKREKTVTLNAGTSNIKTGNTERVTLKTFYIENVNIEFNIENENIKNV